RDLSGWDLRGTDLRGANLRGANLQRAQLQNAYLQGANLRGANLEYAKLGGANLKYADLRDVSLQDAKLQGAKLQGANLQGANLQGAKLDGVNLEGANLNGALLFSVPRLCVTGFRGTPEGGVRLARLPFYQDAGLADVAPESRVTARTEDLDLLFNHRNNEGRSVLYEIEHLADGCRAKKQMLMRSVAGELDRLRQGAPLAALI
ncbi:pentapeptide repeat-containing protein, partial [Paraburkholderia sediminicola]|uniref:pentapeptide repeat-containing protein n=1 Tax=Paraburkholderia sediminicola TaxID=458836 RepID=UPI0038B6D64C